MSKVKCIYDRLQLLYPNDVIIDDKVYPSFGKKKCFYETIAYPITIVLGPAVSYINVNNNC